MFLDAGDDEGGEGEAGPGDGEVPDGNGLEASHTDCPRPQHQLAGPAVEQLQQLRGLDTDLSARLTGKLEFHCSDWGNLRTYLGNLISKLAVLTDGGEQGHH